MVEEALEMLREMEELVVLVEVYLTALQVVLEQQNKVLQADHLAVVFMEQVVEVLLLQARLHQETAVMV